MTLADKQSVNRALLASGATITEMNAVRKHLSRIKGGRLALAAQPAKVVTLVISDVPGDDPASIASGPTIADESTIDEVRGIISRYRIVLPDTARSVLESGDETPKPADLASDVRIIAAPSLALDSAAKAAANAGLQTLVLGDAIEGEARELGTVMAGIALSAKTKGLPVRGPAVLLSGGEGTVTIGCEAAGRGGRNTEFLLGLAVALKGHALAVGEDIAIGAVAAEEDEAAQVDRLLEHCLQRIVDLVDEQLGLFLLGRSGRGRRRLGINES